MGDKDFPEDSSITDIALDKCSPDNGCTMSRLQVIEHDGLNSLFQKPFYDMAADITGSPGYQDLAHRGLSVNSGTERVDYNALVLYLSTESGTGVF
jgi:hypothetical protein